MKTSTVEALVWVLVYGGLLLLCLGLFVLRTDTMLGWLRDPGTLIDHVAAQVPRWWRPDAVTFVDALPHTATGKVSKLLLRQQLADYKLPDDGPAS